MPQFSAFSTEFVIGVSDGCDEFLGALDLLGKLGFSFLISPVVASSLYWIGQNEIETGIRDAAQTAHSKLSSFGILTPDLDKLEFLRLETIADNWRDRDLFPGAHRNDYLAIIEASYLKAQNLITARPIAQIDPRLLNQYLFEARLNPLRLIELRELLI